MTLVGPSKNLAIALVAAAAAWATPALAQQQAPPEPHRQIMVMVPHPPDHFRPGAGYASGGYGDDLARSARERLARKIARQFGLTLVDDWPMPLIGVDCLIMAVPGNRPVQQAADQVARDARVAWTQPVQIYTAQAASTQPNDPLFAAQPAARQWQLAKLQRLSKGNGVRVAVVDSGIDVNHPDLTGQVAINRNFVSGRALTAERHGTGVAGIIAAKAGNGVGLAGIAPAAKLLGLRACWQAAAKTLCDSFSLAKALTFAISQKAPIINMSLSGPDDRLLGQLLKVAMTNGETVVAAFDRSERDGGFPASVPGVVAVSDSSLAAPRSRVYIAPGHDVPTTQPGGRWFLVNGSSFAAAHVSGLLALVRQRTSSLSPSLVAHGGYVDACATLAYAGLNCECSCAPGAAGARLRR